MWAGQRILIVGDSHVVGAPGVALEQLLRDKGAASVDRQAEVGWGPADWLSRRGNELETRILATNPDVVIWWFGTNDSAAEVGDAVGTFRLWAPSSWFLGPPSYSDPQRQARAAALVSIERRVFGSRFVDNRVLTVGLPRGRDDVHFTAEGAEPWAARIVTVMRVRHYRPLYLVGASALGAIVGAVIAGISR